MLSDNYVADGYRCRVDLLERDDALATLVAAHGAAAGGQGRVVFVTGEPGIGKTSLVGRFVGDLGDDVRVLAGTCDDLSIPRPLGPIRDLAGEVSPTLRAALAGGATPHDVHDLLIAELEAEPHPTVLVLEDVHWADDATFDAITVLGRRIGALPALLVLTFRAGEAPPGHRLHSVIGTMRADHSVIVELTPLSEGAVAALAGDDATGVYAATGGNPFYVNELLAARSGEELPATIAHSVVGRASRLDDASRRLVELVSMVPSRTSTALLDAVMPGWTAAAIEPERRQLLQVESSHVRFRHELARHAIRSSVPAAACRRLHGEILEALLAGDADPADIVHHAEAAGADDVVASYALVAARRAAAMGANAEAHSHYVRAGDFADRRPPAEQAVVLEELALAAYMAGRVDDAIPTIERAIAINDELGDVASVGRCKRILSRLHWYAGHGAAARRTGLEAVTLLEPLGESVELAQAYSGLSQMAMLAEDVDGTLLWGRRALELAVRVGDDNVRAHALVNIGSVRMQMGYGEGPTQLLEAFSIADRAGNRHEGARALINLAYTLMCWVRPAEAMRYAQQALAYAERHEVYAFGSYISATMAWLRLRAGAWEEAERDALREIEMGATVAQLLAKTVLAELAVRRGDADAPARLDEVAVLADRAGELQRIAPLLELAFEWSLTTGAPLPKGRFEERLAEVRTRAHLTGWGAIRVAAWAAVFGIDVDVDQPLSAPHAAMLRHDWQAAADAFGEVGWMHDRALMLSLLEDEEALCEALEIARGLGAEPLIGRVTGRMRELGFRVPQGPRTTTRANPAGLTARQLDVVALLVDGLTNAEIAEQLVLSPRTVEHHVAAVLQKLGAPTRREVARRASELQLSAQS